LTRKKTISGWKQTTKAEPMDSAFVVWWFFRWTI